MKQGASLKVFPTLLLVVMAAVPATIAVARASLPISCIVSEAQFNKLSMQMSYEAVKELFGCDGVLMSKKDYGQIVIEDFAWRSAAWPYGRLRLGFISNTLQGTQKLWLSRALNWRQFWPEASRQRWYLVELRHGARRPARRLSRKATIFANDNYPMGK